MSDNLDDAFERIRQDLLSRQARRSFHGIMALLWVTHTPEEILDLLYEQIEYCEDVI